MTKALELGELANYATVNVAGNTVTLDTVLTNDSATVGGNTALTLRTYTDNRAANAFANAVANAASYTDAKVANLVNASPASLDTLNELAAALGNDASFSTTVLTGIASAYSNAVANAASLYLPLAGGSVAGVFVASSNASLGGPVDAESLKVGASQGTTGNANYVGIDGSSGTGTPIIGAWGSNNNVSLSFRTRGTGNYNFGTGSSVSTVQLRIAHTANAVNYAQVTGAATTGAPVISAQGADSNVGLVVQSKGTSPLYLQTVGTTDIRIQPNSLRSLSISSAANAVNYGVWTSAPSGFAPSLAVAGTDTNIDLTLTPKGSGIVRASGGMFVNGAVTVSNSTGNTVTISADGIVGVGTNVANNATLHVVGDWVASNSTVKIQSRTANLAGIGFYNSAGARLGIAYSDTGSSWFESAGALVLNSNNGGSGTNIYIAANGFVGIANSAPSAKLHITGGSLRMDTSGYPIINLNNTDTGNYFLMQFAENNVQRTYFGLGGSTQTFGTYAAYATDGLSLNHDGAGKVTISNRGSSKSIWLCTGTESFSDFPTIILKNKMMQLPTQPRFYAYGVSGSSYTHGSYWVFPSTRVNVGSHYNTSTGIFTVPADGGGTYFFSWGNIGGTTNTVFRYYIYVNNSVVGDEHLRLDCSATGSEYAHNAARNVMLSLSAGDTVRIYFISDSATASYPGTTDLTNNYPYFSGYLMG